MTQLQSENTTSKKKAKKKPTYRFAAWLQEGTKEPDAQIPFKPYQKRVWCRAQHSWLHVETADWISTSSYSKAFEYEYTGIIKEDGKPLKRRRIGKQAENLKEIYWIILDFDNPHITEDLIIQRLHYHNLPEPTYIIRNPLSGHYQAFWIFPIPLNVSYSGWWQSVANRLFKVFSGCEEDRELFCCDSKVLNPNWYARNPYNPKYEMVHKAAKVSLGEIDKALKEAGFRDRRASCKERVYAFLKSNPNYESTHSHISHTLSISLRSVEKACEELREEGKLITKIFGKGKGRKTRFITQFIEVQKKEYLSTTLAGGCVQSGGLDVDSVVSDGMRAAILDAVRRVRVVGLPFRWRNKFTFVLILGLKVMGYRESVVLRLFREIFLKCNHVESHKFSEREFMQTVENAFKPKYRYCISFRNEGWNWEGFLKALSDLERRDNVSKKELVFRRSWDSGCFSKPQP